MFSWLYSSSNDLEILISDRDFELLLVVESPPAAPAQSLAYDDDVPVRSVNLNAIQMMFDQKMFRQNFIWFKFHNDVCGKLS